jgi:hypothetical protein
MITGIDHLVIAVGDLDEAAAALAGSVGLAVTPGGTHPDHGTANRLAWLGDTYLELVAVVDPERARHSWFGRLVLDRLAAGGGLAALCLASDDLAADIAAARGRGVDVAGPFPGERRRPDGRVVRWRLALPDPLGVDAAPFLIEHDPTAAEWTPIERAERAAFVHPVGGPVRLELVELPLDDVRRTRDRYLRTWGLLARPSLAGGGARDVSVGRQIVRLRRQVGAESQSPTVHLVVLPQPHRPPTRRPRAATAAAVLGLEFRWRTADGA